MCEHTNVEQSFDPNPGFVVCVDCRERVPCHHPQFINVAIHASNAPLSKGQHFICTLCSAECAHERLDTPTLGSTERMCIDCRTMVPVAYRAPERTGLQAGRR